MQVKPKAEAQGEGGCRREGEGEPLLTLFNLLTLARDGNLPIVQMLLSYDASPDITDSHGWSAIQYAEMNPDIVQLCEESLRRKRPDVTVSRSKHIYVLLTSRITIIDDPCTCQSNRSVPS
jgi:hypothetical protein